MYCSFLNTIGHTFEDLTIMVIEQIHMADSARRKESAVGALIGLLYGWLDSCSGCEDVGVAHSASYSHQLIDYLCSEKQISMLKNVVRCTVMLANNY